MIFYLAGVLGDERRPREYFRKVNVGGTRILAEAALVERVGYFAKMLKRRWVPKVPGWLGIVSSILLEKVAGLTGRQPLFTKGAVRGTLKFPLSYHDEIARHIITKVQSMFEV